MSEIKSVSPLVILSPDEAWDRFGDLALESFLHDMMIELSENQRTYELPRLVDERQALASKLAQTIVSYGQSGLLCITHWWEDTTSFDEYRRSLGETRPLVQAPIHLFSGEHREEIERLLKFILDLEWDCFIFDKALKFLIEISHDGYVKLSGWYSDSVEKGLRILKTSSM